MEEGFALGKVLFRKNTVQTLRIRTIYIADNERERNLLLKKSTSRER
jgi:hypothetical protein